MCGVNVKSAIRSDLPSHLSLRQTAHAGALRLKSFGERIMARDPDRQTAEIHIRIALMNRFNALGTAEIVHAA